MILPLANFFWRTSFSYRCYRVEIYLICFYMQIFSLTRILMPWTHMCFGITVFLEVIGYWINHWSCPCSLNILNRVMFFFRTSSSNSSKSIVSDKLTFLSLGYFCYFLFDEVHIKFLNKFRVLSLCPLILPPFNTLNRMHFQL